MACDPQSTATEFDRTARGFPNFGYRLRKLEQRVRSLEAALSATTSSDTDRRRDAEYTVKETTDEHRTDR